MGEWRTVDLAEVADDISYGYTESASDEPIGPKFLRITDIVGGTVNWATVPYCPINEKDLAKYRLIPGDIVIARTGATTGANYTVRETDPKDVVFASYLIRYRIDRSRALPEYVGYCLRSSLWSSFVEGVSGGSAQPGANAKVLGGFEFDLPDLPEQRAIASVLSSLDAKIDLLHRQNKTLEAMAETLFRQWFVEEAEEGWEDVGLLDVVKLVPGGTPKTTQANYWDGDIMWISVREISENHKGFVNYAYKTITEEGLDNSAANLLPKFGTVISARGTVGKIGLLAQPMAYSQSNFGVLPKDSSNYFFTYMLVHNSIEELHSNSYGAVFDTITTQSFQTIRHRLPGTEVINSFEALVRPMFLKMLNNTEQITSLTKLRNTLLPKLMSGEVRVES